ncbi:MAG: ATP-binding protein [Candidatus Eremiobacteraeota bacterium]|nr:ATP-binding protein [Candidatus Eremiobacteraeota bacterium]
MKISVASGKGGTGKTTVAVNLAYCAEEKVQLLDCDVEEPNCHLFLAPSIKERVPVTLEVPEIALEKCTYCGRCAKVCRFNAIAVLLKNAMVFPELCHGCGGCLLACPESAITLRKRAIGMVEKGMAGHIHFVHGRLEVGVALSPPLVKAVKREALQDAIVIFDAPPGTSCPMVATVKGTDFCILVTEPTPFGLHDLSIALETVRKIAVPAGVVINRAGRPYRELNEYLDKEHIEVLCEIPFERKYAESYSTGAVLAKAHPELKACFSGLLRKVAERCGKAALQGQMRGER